MWLFISKKVSVATDRTHGSMSDENPEAMATKFGYTVGKTTQWVKVLAA